MSGLDLTKAMIAQLTAALASLGAEPSDYARLEQAERQDVAGFARLFGEHMELLERLCCRRDQVPVFAHLAGGMMCRAVIHCLDLRAVLDRSGQFSAMIAGQDRSSRLVRDGDVVRFEIVSRYATQDDAALLSDLIGLQYHLALLSWLGGRMLQPDGVTLAYPRPAGLNPLLGLFHGTIEFDAPRNALLFTEAALARPVVRRADELEAIIDCFPYNVILDAIGDQGLSAQVKRLMGDALRQGHGLPSEGAIGHSFGVSVATLRRKLGREGTNYRQLRALSLCDEAERLMQDRDCPIALIAQRLGFSDDRAFRRAFKNWTGISPSASPARILS